MDSSGTVLPFHRLHGKSKAGTAHPPPSKCLQGKAETGSVRQIFIMGMQILVKLDHILMRKSFSVFALTFFSCSANISNWSTWLDGHQLLKGREKDSKGKAHFVSQR